MGRALDLGVDQGVKVVEVVDLRKGEAKINGSLESGV